MTRDGKFIVVVFAGLLAFFALAGLCSADALDDELASIDQETARLAARRVEVLAAIAERGAVRYPADIGWRVVKPGESAQAALSAVVGQTWMPGQVVLAEGRHVGSVNWIKTNGELAAYAELRGTGRDRTFLNGSVATNSYLKAFGNEAFCNGVRDLSIIGNLDWLVSNKGSLWRVDVAGDLLTSRDWTGPARTFECNVAGNLVTGPYHSPIFHERLTVGKDVLNRRTGVMLYRSSVGGVVRNIASAGMVVAVDSTAADFKNEQGQYYLSNSFGVAEKASRDLSPGKRSLNIRLRDMPTTRPPLAQWKRVDASTFQAELNGTAPALYFAQADYQVGAKTFTIDRDVFIHFGESRLRDAGDAPVLFHVRKGKAIIEGLNTFGGSFKGQTFFKVDAGAYLGLRDARFTCGTKFDVSGQVDVENVATGDAGPTIIRKGGSFHGKQFDPETPAGSAPHVVNEGEFACYSYKQEGKAPAVWTKGTGRTEITGAMIYEGGGTFPAGVRVFPTDAGGLLSLRGIQEGAETTTAAAKEWAPGLVSSQCVQRGGGSVQIPKWSNVP